MGEKFAESRGFWLVVGVVLGCIGAALLPHASLHAISSDRNQDFVLSTGYLDDETEGVFILNPLTGDIKGTAINPFGKFNSMFEANAKRDLGSQKNSRFMMVTGRADLQRQGGNIVPANNVLYVADASTGQVAAYGIPWSSALNKRGEAIVQQLVLLDVFVFDNNVVRGAAGGKGKK